MTLAFGERLKALLRKREMSQRDLAKVAKITAPAINHYLDGTREPRASVLAKISLALNVSADYLLGLTARSSSGARHYDSRRIYQSPARAKQGRARMF